MKCSNPRSCAVLCLTTILLARSPALLAQDSAPAIQSQPASQPAAKPRSSEGDIDLLSLDVPVVVSAARHEQPINAVPAAISIITAEEIRRSGARSIPDALRLVPGVDVADLGYGNAAVSPRGLHGFLSRQVLVLVDGRQLFDSLFGGTLWGNWPISLEDVDRIEVIRGPAGVTWGANAVNGVINIITKNPADQQGVTISTSAGTQATHREYGAYGFADDKLKFRVSGEHEGSSGFSTGGTFLLRPEDDYRAYRASTYLTYAPTDRDKFIFSAGSSLSDSGFPRSPLGGLFGGGRDGSQANFILGRWERALSPDSELDTTFYVNDFTATPGLKAVDYRYQQYALQLGLRFKPAPEHSFTMGLDMRGDALDATQADPFMTSRRYLTSGTFGIYVEDEWRFAPKWLLNVGARLDYDTYGGFQPSGRAALSYHFNDDTSLYGSVARAFQTAPVGLRHLDMPLLDGLARATANQELDAQTLIAYEFGYRGRFLDKALDLQSNLFWNQYSDLTTLSPRLGPPGLLNNYEDNRASAGLYGAEFEAKYKINKEWTLLANYTYQQLGWHSDARIQDKDMMTPPTHKFMLAPRWSPRDDLHFAAQAWWVDGVDAPNPWNPFATRNIPPYWRLDLRAEYDFWKNRAQLAVGVRNLLDDHHPEGATLFLNDVEVPRMIYAELQIHYK